MQRSLCVNGISHTREMSGHLRATFAVCKWDKSYSEVSGILCATFAVCKWDMSYSEVSGLLCATFAVCKWDKSSIDYFIICSP